MPYGKGGGGLNSFLNKPMFSGICSTRLMKTGKKTIARNKQFLLFPQHFFTLGNFFTIFINLEIVVCKLWVSADSKICHMGRVSPYLSLHTLHGLTKVKTFCYLSVLHSLNDQSTSWYDQCFDKMDFYGSIIMWWLTWYNAKQTCINPLPNNKF